VTAEEPADAYEVGYGKPPVGTRFKPGQSGNPAGRPRGSKSEATVARAVLSETFPVTLKGRRRNIAVFEASFRRQCQKALEGDAKAFAIVERYQQKHVPELAAVNQDVDEAGPGASLISEIFLDMARQAVAKERGGEIEP
jgi:hypothetical protein